LAPLQFFTLRCRLHDRQLQLGHELWKILFQFLNETRIVLIRAFRPIGDNVLSSQIRYFANLRDEVEILVVVIQLRSGTPT